jgi:hypothetical protein
MLRLVEIGLFLLPFAMVLAWQTLPAHRRNEILLVASAAVVVLVGAAIGFGLHDRMDPHARYVPAHLEGGVIVPGRGTD